MNRPKSRLVLICVALTTLSCTSLQTNTTDNKFHIRDYQSRTPAVDTEFRHPTSGKTFWEEYENPDPIPLPVPVLTEFFGIKIPAESAPKDVKQMATVMRWVRENPNPVFKAIRNRSPILKIAPLPIKEPVNSVGGVQGQNIATYIITKHKDVVEVLNKPTVFTVRNYTDKIQPSVGNFMLAQDGSHYNMREKPWMRQMLPREDLPRVRQLVRRLAQKAIEEGTYIAETPEVGFNGKRHYARIELVNKLARRVPIQLTQQYFGFSADEHSMYRWSRATQFDFFHNVTNDPEIRQEAVQAGREMQRFVGQLVEQRKRDLVTNPNMDDILSRLIKNRNSEALRDIINTAHITDGRITTNVIGLLVGNVETTEAAVVQSLEVLFQNPEILQQAIRAAKADNMDLLEKYVWEALRFNPVNPFVVRYAEKDQIIAAGTDRETKILKGSIVLVATQSAMFDEENFENPEQFRVDRQKEGTYFHLGYGHHRCLGDYVSEVQVPELVRAVLLLKDVRPEDGYQGQVNKKGGRYPDKEAFPEKFVVRYDTDRTPPTDRLQFPEPDFAFEEYLQDFNRDSFRTCLAGNKKGFHNTIIGIPANIVRHRNNDYKRMLLFCRLSEPFRICIKQASNSRGKKFSLNRSTAHHEAAFERCSDQHNLTSTEKAFYKQIMLQKNITADIAANRISTAKAERKGGWEYEDHLKFYDRYTYRECLMNPAAWMQFPDSERMLFYARLPIEFRMCMGPPVLLNSLVSNKLGKTRDEQYRECVNGVYSKASGRYEGALSATERYYYERLILGKNE